MMECKPNNNIKYIVHVQLNDTEIEIPLFAESLDKATEWAEEQYESQGYVINRIRQSR